MKAILGAIRQQKQHYARLPFFDFLRDDNLEPEQRLAFYPCMAHFIMSFGDLNKYVLRVEPATDVYQQLVNDHTYEDDHHWPWYIEDFNKLGFHQLQTATDWLTFLWSDETHVNRLLSCRLATLIDKASSIQRLAIIEAIEETGNVLFSLTARLARLIQAAKGIELRYCGDFHFSLESGHTVGADHGRLAEIELNETMRQETLQMVDDVFVYFTEWTDELLHFALTQLGFSPSTVGAADESHSASHLPFG